MQLDRVFFFTLKNGITRTLKYLKQKIEKIKDFKYQPVFFFKKRKRKRKTKIK